MSRTLVIKIATMVLIAMTASVVSAVAIWGIVNHELPPVTLVLGSLYIGLICMAPLVLMDIRRSRKAKVE